MKLDWKTYTLNTEWDSFTLDQWDEFLLDPTIEGIRFIVAARSVFTPADSTRGIMVHDDMMATHDHAAAAGLHTPGAEETGVLTHADNTGVGK